MPNQDKELIQKGINTVRILAADAVQKANSGHPGTPMGLAPIGHVLWAEAMNYNPANAHWANRDRFVLSAGHACMLQYAYLYLTGYDITMDDIKQFRQLHSKTAGHPEYGLLDGVEITTGPLGQGFANGVGLAIAQQYLAGRYNKEGFDLFNYNIYAICSDGDIMEGITAEAASVAGHLQLGNLIYIYDDNHISIEGDTSLAIDEDVAKRFESYNWHVQVLQDGNDTEAIARAINIAQKETGRPSLIKIRTHIAFGSPNKVDTAGSHGSPLGEEEIKLVKTGFGFDPNEFFVVPGDVLEYYRSAVSKGSAKENEWDELYASYKQTHPELAAEYEAFTNGELPADWTNLLPSFEAGENVETRKASGKVLNAVAKAFPLMIGGSADLSPSTDTALKDYESFSVKRRDGRNFHFGIREHSMGAILNGIAVTKGFLPFGATFLIFSDYMRPPIRLAAIMKIKPIFIYTHDSIGLGEDGTTHQPVEQLLALRAIPNLVVLRPADANETVEAWRVAIEHKGGPVALVLTRQKLPVIDREKYAKPSGLAQGAYILSESKQDPALIIIATGSEVQLALAAQEKLEAENISTRVVSMPSWELFEKQPREYRDQVLPPTVKHRLSVEAASILGWSRYVPDERGIIGINQFGESAPGEQIMKEYGFSVDNVVEKAHLILSGN